MNQNAKLLNYLEQHPEGITTLEAMEKFRICRLSERIRELEDLGYSVDHIPEKTENARYMRYKLKGQLSLLGAAA